MFKDICAVLGAVLLLVVIFLAEAILGCWLWGIIAVGVFGLPALTFWQFYGLLVLIHILFPSTTACIGGGKR